MNRLCVCLAFANFLKFFFSFTVAILLLTPLTLVHEFKTGSKVTNDTIFTSAQFGCRIPRSNIKITEKDLTDTLYLPEGALLFDHLHRVAVCKSSTQTTGINSADCFCMGFCLVYVCGVLAVLGSILSFFDTVWALLKRNVLYTLTECQSCQSCIKFLTIASSFVIFIITLHIVILASNYRFTLRNHIYDRAYYETPFVWWIVLMNCSIYFLVSLLEMAVLARMKSRLVNASNSLPDQTKSVIQNQLIDRDIVVELGSEEPTLDVKANIDSLAASKP